MVFKVFLDSNILMMVAEKRLDIFRQIETILQGKIEFTVPKTVFAELSTIAQEKSKRGRYARFALELAKKCMPGRENPGAEESTDDYLARVAKETRGIVVTADSELRKRLRNANMPVIYVRKDLRLAIEGIEPAYR